MILTATQGSYQIDKVEKSIRAVLPNAKGIAKVQKDTFTVDESVSGNGDCGDSEDDAEILQVLVSDMQMNDEYDEENMLDTFETYKQVRSRIMENKKVRGYKPTTTGRLPWKLTGIYLSQAGPGSGKDKMLSMQSDWALEKGMSQSWQAYIVFFKCIWWHFSWEEQWNQGGAHH